MKKRFKLPDKIVVRVTKADIKNGLEGSSSSCPVALALRRKFPKRKVRVLPAACAVGGLWRMLPCKATEFIADYDFGDEVKSFQFTIKKKGTK